MPTRDYTVLHKVQQKQTCQANEFRVSFVRLHETAQVIFVGDLYDT